MTCLMVFFSDKIQGTVNWMAGGFSGASWKHVTMILPYTIIGLVGVSISSKLLNALQLGDDVAKVWEHEWKLQDFSSLRWRLY